MSERFQLGEFWLAKRPDAASEHWQITWYDKRSRQTRQRTTGTADFEQAKTKLAEHYVARGERKNEPAAAVLVESVLMRYYEAHAKNLPSAGWASYSIAYWNKFWEGATVADMTTPRLEAFQQWLAAGTKRPMKPATINRVIAVGRAALQRAYKRQELASAPHIPGVTVPRQRLYRASPDEMARLLNATAKLPHVRKWLVGSIVTLARPEAVLELSRPQLDFQLRRIDLNQPGREQNDKHRPIIPMTDTAYAWLSGDWTGLWITYKGKPLESIRMGFERARDRAGLSAKITPYTIRRTVSTELRRRGVAPWELAGYLGHSVREFSVTEGYAEYAPDYLSDAARAIEDYCAELHALVDFDILRTNCVPVEKPARAQVSDVIGRREWDRTTDHHHVKGSSPSKIHKLRRS